MISLRTITNISKQGPLIKPVFNKGSMQQYNKEQGKEEKRFKQILERKLDVKV